MEDIFQSQRRQQKGKRTVDVQLRVTNDLLDQSLLLEVGQSLAGERAVDLETVDQGGDGDQTVGLDILVELLRGGLVEDDGVVGLVLDCITKQMRQLNVLFHVLR